MTTPPTPYTPLFEQAHQWLLPALNKGGLFFDATCGNGNDTLFLCQNAKPGSRVVGIDLQESAIRRTKSLLEQHGKRADLFVADHAHIDDILQRINLSVIEGAIFNLGYLPKGNHSIVTRASTTLTAITIILAHASPTMRLSVVAYRGHPGGIEEESAVRGTFEKLVKKGFKTTLHSGSASPLSPVFFGLASREGQ